MVIIKVILQLYISKNGNLKMTVKNKIQKNSLGL